MVIVVQIKKNVTMFATNKTIDKMIILETTFKTLSIKKTPIWFMRQAGRYLPEYREIRSKNKNFLDMCYNSDLLSEITLQPIKRFDLDFAIIFSDILVILDSFNIFNISFKENIGPIVKKYGDLKNLKIIDIDFNKKIFQEIYNGIKKTRNELDKSKSLIGFIGAPWTLACYACNGKSSKDFHEVKIFAYNNPETFSNFIDILTEACVIHSLKQIESGANVIQIFDSWSNVLDSDDYENWVLKPFIKISSKIKQKYPNIPIIWFPRASFAQYEQFLKKEKNLQQYFDCLSVDYGTSIQSLVGILPTNIVFQGNLDPSILACENFNLVEKKILNILKLLKNRLRIFNLGHGMLQNAKIDNVKKTIDLVRKFDESLF